MKECYNSHCPFSGNESPHNCECAEMCERYLSDPSGSCFATTSNRTQPLNDGSMYSATTGPYETHREGSFFKE